MNGKKPTRRQNYARDRMSRRPLRGKAPTLRLERESWEEGAPVVVGLDEVGKGSWAGPLTLAAVVEPERPRIQGIRDSTLLSPERREVLHERILDWWVASGVGHATPA